MKEATIVRTVTAESNKFGKYEIQFVEPPAATVTLCTFTGTPQEAMYLVVRGYKGIYDPNPLRMPGDGYDKFAAMQDIQKTKLQTPLEMIHMLWLFQDVSRAFTHQLVRYRVGTAFVQESMRFFGMRKIFKVLVTHEAANVTEDPPEWNINSNLETYVYGAEAAIKSYVEMLDRDIPDQDARGVLPTNILTNIYFDCSLRTLQNIFPQRLCCQAQQGEWQPILLEMREQIKLRMGKEIESMLRAPYEKGEDCGYRASFDRPCVWKKGANIVIPYYENHAGIRTPQESETECTCNQYYVVLDKIAVDALDPDVWNTFDAIKEKCEEELKQFLNIFEATHAISPEGDETYILNFTVQEIPNTKGWTL